MKKRETHRDLIAWREAMRLVAIVYRETNAFPKQEIFGLTSQIRRAVVSVPSNIAEGAARSSTKEFAQFLRIACSSLAELETQLEIAVLLGYLPADNNAVRHTWRVGMLVRRLRHAVAQSVALPP